MNRTVSFGLLLIALSFVGATALGNDINSKLEHKLLHLRTFEPRKRLRFKSARHDFG